jgi:LDH2 family malate/lactate/ureidoglycolate dehydrogenase
VSELLGQVLTGSDLCREEPLGGGLYTRTGSIFVAIGPTIFRPLADFVSATNTILNKIKDVPPAPGFKEVLVPGEPEHRTRSLRITEGISLPEVSWQILQQQAAKYGLDLTSVMG